MKVNSVFNNYYELWQEVSKIAETKPVLTKEDLLFDRPAGYTYGTWDNPVTGNLNIDLTDAVEGGCCVVIWQGSTNPSITGANIKNFSGNITTAGTYSIYFHYISGWLNINIFNVDGQGSIPPPSGETAPVITVTNPGGETPPTITVT